VARGKEKSQYSCKGESWLEPWVIQEYSIDEGGKKKSREKEAGGEKRDMWGGNSFSGEG